MGFGTTLYTEICFGHKVYKTKDEVESDIYDVKDTIYRCKQNIKNLAIITEPKKYMSDDNEEPIFWLEDKVNDNLEILEESCIMLYKLEKLLEDWDKCHQGNLELRPPKNNNNHYIASDFCDGVYPDGNVYIYNIDEL